MRKSLLVAAGILLLLPLSAALASPIGPVSQIVVFGDSLSDNGNAAIVLGGTLPGNYAPNAFTDGPNTSPATTGPFGLWIDQLAPKLNVPDPMPALAGGTNYAVASAQTGTAHPQDIGNQLALFGSTHLTGASPNALYVVWGGANDIFNGSSNGAGAADTLFGYILSLSQAGAKYFLWPDLPALGNTPLGSSNAASLNAQSAAFDAEWAVDLTKLQAGGIDAIGVSIDKLFANIVGSPGSYGFTNVTTPAQGVTGANPNNYLFWDTEHPTTAADAFIADAAYAALSTPNSAVPEPLDAGLAMLGLSAIGLSKARRAKARLRF